MRVVVGLCLLLAVALGRPAPATAVVTVRPIDGPVVRPFEAPPDPYARGHRGVDLAAAGGTPVRSARAGRVTFAGEVAGVGWVTVDHGAGLDTTYGDVDARVERGDRVRAGQVLGTLDAAARHLDWGARWTPRGGRRTWLDPLLLLATLRAVLVGPRPTDAAAATSGSLSRADPRV